AVSAAELPCVPVVDGADGLPVGSGVGALAGALSAADFRASVTARPCGVELDDGVLVAFELDFGDAEELGVVVGDFDGVEFELPGALGLGLLLGDELGVVLVGWPSNSASTWRKSSRAVVPTCCSAWSALVPLGMLTMMLSDPSVCTSASETPRPLTR